MIRVFCDFDGTIATEDVGNHLFRTFAGRQALEIVGRYVRGELTARECLTKECEAIDSITPDECQQFVDQFTLDPHFPQFVEFCERQRIPLTILSDGLDVYVEQLLTRNGLAHLSSFANHAEFVPVDGKTKILVSFPYADAECRQCGNCKRNHMLTLSADDDFLVFVGDGISDRCAVRYADVVFAKRDLIRYCQEQNITYHTFRHFGDVQTRLEEMLGRKHLRPRREAVMARREAFLQG